MPWNQEAVAWTEFRYFADAWSSGRYIYWVGPIVAALIVGVLHRFYGENNF